MNQWFTTFIRVSSLSINMIKYFWDSNCQKIFVFCWYFWNKYNHIHIRKILQIRITSYSDDIGQFGIIFTRSQLNLNGLTFWFISCLSPLNIWLWMIRRNSFLQIHKCELDSILIINRLTLWNVWILALQGPQGWPWWKVDKFGWKYGTKNSLPAINWSWSIWII